MEQPVIARSVFAARNDRLVVFLNSAKPELFILFCHLDKICQPLFEFGGSFSCSIDETDADTLIGIRKFLKILPGYFVRFYFYQNIFRNTKFLFRNIPQSFADFFNYFFLLEQRSQPLLVGRGILAVWFAGRESLGKTFLINRPNSAIDPTEAERFFNRIVIFDARLARSFLVIDKPDLFFCFVMLTKPGSPFFAIRQIKSFHIFVELTLQRLPARA